MSDGQTLRLGPGPDPCHRHARPHRRLGQLPGRSGRAAGGLLRRRDLRRGAGLGAVQPPKGFCPKQTADGDYHGFLGAQWQLSKASGGSSRPGPRCSFRRTGASCPIRPAPSTRWPRGWPPATTSTWRSPPCGTISRRCSASTRAAQDHMPIRPGKPVPACLRHFGTTWMLVSRGPGGTGDGLRQPRRSSRRIRNMLAKGEIRRVEGLWVTHYHDDHVDAIPAIPEGVRLPVHHRPPRGRGDYATRWPGGCRASRRARPAWIGRPRDGESWQWHEFKLTAYHFPGQTLYHGGPVGRGRRLADVLRRRFVHHGGHRRLLRQNRNWLGRGVGFDRCIALIEKLRPTHIFNCHVNEAFDFTPEGMPLHAGEPGRAGAAFRPARALGPCQLRHGRARGSAATPTSRRPRRAPASIWAWW